MSSCAELTVSSTRMAVRLSCGASSADCTALSRVASLKPTCKTTPTSSLRGIPVKTLFPLKTHFRQKSVIVDFYAACCGPCVILAQELERTKDTDHVWEQLRREALEQSEEEPYLASFFYATILVHPSLERSLAFHLANKLANPTLLSTQLFTLFWETFTEDSGIQEALRSDIRAFRERDPACTSYVHGMLNYKGFLACEAHRIAHRLWGQGRFALALALQNRISEVFQVDIHPGAQIGKGVLFDHATGVVIGETAVIGDNVSILHHVTLGGTGNRCGIRHPRIGDGVLIGAAAILLGPIVVGDGAKIGACSLVLIDVPPHTTAVGVPAQILGRGGKAASAPVKEELPALSMDHTSLILDYII